MYGENTWPPESFRELEPLCDKGHVMLVQNTADGQLYVKKRVRTFSPGIYRQLREQPAAGTPEIYGIYPDGGAGASGAASLVIIEEYIPGRTLAEQLQEEGPFPEAEVIAIGLQLCGILRELHSRKPALIHRDIKPGNIIRRPDGRIVLLDFSAAKPRNTQESRDTVLIGTAGFAAPEQYGFSASTPQTDLYALGVLLNVLATGAMPWERLAGGRLRRIIRRCLKLEPKDRYIDARELQSALKRAAAMGIEWLPPGFRSLKWYKMIPAALWYLYILYFSLTHTVNGSDPVHELSSRLLYGAAHLFPTLFYGNYLDVQRFFPFMRSKSRHLRIVGLVIAPFVTLFLGVAIYLFVTAFCYATGRALFG